MTPQQVHQVQASFAKVEPIADQAAALFYRRLFETAPEVRALFSGDMEVQGRKLMTAIATVVNSLGEIAAVAPAVCDLAKRHVAYGVRPEHYELVGAALMWTLEQGLGDDFTPAVSADAGGGDRRLPPAGTESQESSRSGALARPNRAPAARTRGCAPANEGAREWRT